MNCTYGTLTAARLVRRDVNPEPSAATVRCADLGLLLAG